MNSGKVHTNPLPADIEPWTRGRDYTTLQMLPWLAQRTTPMRDESPQHNTIPALFWHYCGTVP
jgi:hypothetical protein